jgi:hypothetical protein
MGITKGGLVSARIEKARVIDVDTSTYTLTIATAFAKKPMTAIPFATPYQHFVNGEGIYFMPEVGSLCWLCEPSDGCMPFILAWGSGQDEADFTARKQSLNPGDIYLGTRDENFMILKRGGVVQIGSTGICQRIFMPLNNLINDFCENYKLNSLGGDLEWVIKRDENTTDGTRPALLKLYAKEFADDPTSIADLEIGSHDNDSKTILSLVIYDNGTAQQQQKISLSMTKDGDVSWEVEKDYNLTVKGNYTGDVTGDINITGHKTATVSVTGALKVHTDADATLEAKQVTVDSPMTKMTGTVQANGQIPVALATPLILWLGSHTHKLLAPTAGSDTAPPSIPPTSNIASGQLFSS